MTEKPKWYKLINYWLNEKDGTGLTLPFIVGAIDNMTISKLISEINELDINQAIILQVCDSLQEYILTFDYNRHPIAEGKKGLVFNDKLIESFDSLNEVIRYLENKYSTVISKKTYSKNMYKNIWEEYTQQDKELIKNALST